jgi:3D (Asp-Asp-Asp) domain-containing protein
MRSFFGRSAVVAATLLSSSFILSATSSVAETPLPLTRQQKQEQKAVRSEISAPSSTSGPADASSSSKVSGVVIEATDPAGGLNGPSEVRSEPVTAPVHYTATAYSLYGKTASGKRVSKGLIAADPSVLPLGTRVRLDAGSYSGDYLVADTGGAVRGKRIDIWTPTSREAMRFGRRLVRLTVLSYGPRRLSLRRQRTR